MFLKITLEKEKKRKEKKKEKKRTKMGLGKCIPSAGVLECLLLVLKF